MRALLVLLLLAFTLGVAACGGSSPRLSRSDFVQKANAVCEKYNDELRALPRPTSAAEFADFVHKGKALVRKQVDELGGLKPPAALQPAFDRLLAVAGREAPILDQMEVAAKGGDLKKAQRLDAKLSAVDAKANGDARRLGLTVCAERP